MNASLVGVLLLTALVASTTPVNDDELANQILQRASRSVKGTSFLDTLDNFLFLFQQGSSSVGSELLNNVLFTLDFITPSFDYVMDSVYGRGYRLNENYKKYVQMYMTEDQIADHNHLMKIFKEQFNGDYDSYLQSGINTGNLYGTTQPISQSALDYLGRTISGNFPAGQQYTQQQLANGVASVLQGFENVQNPSHVYYFPQKLAVPIAAPSQPQTPSLGVSEQFLPNSGWQQDPNGDWFYITYLKNREDAQLSDGSLSGNQPLRPPGPPPYGSYEYHPPSSIQIQAKPRSYVQTSSQPRAQSQSQPPSGSYQNIPPVQHPDSARQMYGQTSEKKKVETKDSREYPYEEYAVSPPRFPPQSLIGDNFPQPARPSSSQGLGKQANEYLSQNTQQEQSSYTSYEISDADPNRSDHSKMYPPDPLPNFEQNETGKGNGVPNLEGIPETFLDSTPQPYSVLKSRKKRLADLYQSDLPPKILFCPPENLKLLLCAGDIVMDVFLVKPVLYVLSWFV